MIDVYRVKQYCCEDYTKIENYELAIADNTIWDCHHKLEMKDGINVFTKNELIEQDLYYNRPANELIFITHTEHAKMHNSGKNNNMYGVKKYGKDHPKYGTHCTEETKNKISLSNKGKNAWNKGKNLKKFKWLTPDGQIVEMDKGNVNRWHPDWQLIEE